MQTIIIGDGLARDVLSPDLPFRDSRRNVGRAEIERLLGRGKAFGAGPLPTFLERAVGARGVEVVLLDELGEATSGEPSPQAGPGAGGSGFVDPLEDIARESVMIRSPGPAVPWRDLQAHLGSTGAGSEAGETRFLVVGCHTEQRIAAITTFLRNLLESPRVAVVSHLVGSATPAAHFAALRHGFPSVGIEVILDLEEAARYVGLEPALFQALGCRPCALDMSDEGVAFDQAQRRIVELLCLHWTRARLRPLAGGFSGSLLLLADGWKGPARTEPMVLKIDAFSQMRRELDGYHLVKDFFGKHVPTFGYPVTGGNLIGVGMELAAMEGRPGTLQDTFEEADDEGTLELFMRRLDKSLALLSEKLYRNTRERSRVVPYRAFALHTQQQLEWLRENAELTLSYFGPDLSAESRVDPDQLQKLLRLIAANEDGVESEICLSHGDLNFANVICDAGDNIWFIDWTHCGISPVEADFAKLESDAKFVMSKHFDADDLPRLKKLEEYFVSQRLPAGLNGLPERLKFAKWDLRFRKLVETVRRIREACFALKESDDWLVYRIALLHYGLHTLSFDKRRDRGECDAPQLMHALYSVEGLMFDLVADDYHLRIRGERPATYPPRQRISIDEAPWLLECPDYDPPYHVDPAVLANDRTKTEGGWADPEELELVKDEPRIRAAKRRDDSGRPLNPRARTGIAGRGLLGLWGANLSVAVTVVRTNEGTGQLEILLGNQEGGQDLDLPKGFVLPGEAPEAAVGRVLERETGWRPPEAEREVVFSGYTYDRRQTDHAWVESRVFLVSAASDLGRSRFQAGGEFDEIRWWPLEAGTVNRVPSGRARFVREAVAKLVEDGRIERELAESLLAATG